MNVFQRWRTRLALKMIKSAMPLWCKCKGQPFSETEELALQAIQIAKAFGGEGFPPIHRQFMMDNYGSDEHGNIYDAAQFHCGCYGNLNNAPLAKKRKGNCDG